MGKRENFRSSLSKARVDVEYTERVLTLVDAHQMCFHVVTSTENALANRTPGLARVQVLVQCQRHRVLETLPTNSTAKQEAGVRRSAGLTVVVIRDELGDAAGRNGVGVVVVATRGGVSRGSLYKENNKHTTSPPRIVSRNADGTSNVRARSHPRPKSEGRREREA